MAVSRGDCLIRLACSHRGTRSHTQCGPCAPWGICRYLLVAWLLLLLSWLLLQPAQPRGWRLISIQSQALPRWLNRPARLRRLRAPRCLQILPALRAYSPAQLGEELGPNTGAEFGRAGQGRIPRRKGRQGFPSHLLLGRCPQGGLWARTMSPWSLCPARVYRGATTPRVVWARGHAVVGKGVGGLAERQNSVSSPIHAFARAGWERSNSWDAVWMRQGPDRAGGCWKHQLRVYSDPAAFLLGGDALFIPHGQRDAGTPPFVPVNRRGVFGLGEGLLVKAQGQERMGMAFS